MAHMATVGSNMESEAEEQGGLIDNEEGPRELEEQLVVDDAESMMIDGDEYVAVDVYNNEYYARDNKEEHMFALMEHQDDRNATVEDKAKNLALVARILASLPEIIMTEKEFQGNLKRGDALDQPKEAGIMVVKKAHAERVSQNSLECQPTSSRVKVEVLVTDEVEEKQQSAASTVETTNSTCNGHMTHICHQK
ncbi:hypothetical protein C0993_009294 [Termitomyces sp. T159_Od127]|nr:hypothetical protein C0993_009294 [Termitomyces sp. T159_Od127]